jgi:hypothetical protein
MWIMFLIDGIVCMYPALSTFRRYSLHLQGEVTIQRPLSILIVQVDWLVGTAVF